MKYFKYKKLIYLFICLCIRFNEIGSCYIDQVRLQLTIRLPSFGVTGMRHHTWLKHAFHMHDSKQHFLRQEAHFG